jgi:hypothetical protein
MPTALQSRLAALADSFAIAVLDAVRATSLKELLSETDRRAPSPRGARPRVQAPPQQTLRATDSRRLRRRSADDIATALSRVVALVKGHKEGLRAEQIRSELQMQSKEMPRVLAEGLTKRKLRKRGQKRATTYFAA